MTAAVTPLVRTLDQEFVMRLRGVLACPECRALLADGSEVPEVVLPRAIEAS